MSAAGRPARRLHPDGGPGRRSRPGPARWRARLALAVAVLALVGGCGSSPRRMGTDPVDRVLVVSLPGVGWKDVQRYDLPNLEAFLEQAAVGDMSTRIGRRNATATDAYMTIGAGTRAVAPRVDTAVALDSDDPDDLYGGVPTAEILQRRLGYVPGGIAYVASGAAADVNERSAFGAEVGLLGDVLDEAGVARAVIANADAVEGFVSDERPPDGYYSRAAATALMGSNGMVPNGKVSRSLLVDDPAAPFGRRLDGGAVLDAFTEAWQGDDLSLGMASGQGPGVQATGGARRVVLVEASDIARAVAYGGRSTSGQRQTLRTEALVQADELLGRILAQVDAERDAVMVLSPVSPSRTPELGMAAIRAPGVEPGLLQSATTRRDGYVHLADVAPTVVELLGEEFPADVEGRAFQVGGTDVGDRVGYLIDSADAAAFRDGFLPTVVVAISVLVAALVAASALRERLAPPVRAVLAWVALAVLGAVPGSFLAGQVALAHDDVLGHSLVIAAVGAMVASGAMAVERFRPGLGVVLAVGFTVGLFAVDVLTGARLQMNTLFGYSVAVAGRFTGLGNLAYALFGAAAIVLAALLVERYGPRVLGPVVAMLAAVVLLDGLPMLGADVGGVVSLIPAFGVTALLLSGRRVGWRELTGLAGLAAVVVLVFAFVDAARPAETHTHLARLAHSVLDGDVLLLVKNVNRRWQASFGSLDVAGWATIAMALGLAWIYAAVRFRGAPLGRFLRGRSWPAPVTAAIAGLAVLGALGLVANDSSLAVPATTLIVALPVWVVRTMTGHRVDVPVAGTGRIDGPDLADAGNGTTEPDRMRVEMGST